MKAELAKSFEMNDLGQARQILGMQITRDRGQRKLWLSQESYIEKILKRFNMDQSKPVTCPLPPQSKLSKKMSPSTEEDRAMMEKVPYASAIGSLMYAMVCTRPDIAYAVGKTSRYLANLGKQHWEAVKWILRYLRAQLVLGLIETYP